MLIRKPVDTTKKSCEPPPSPTQQQEKQQQHYISTGWYAQSEHLQPQWCVDDDTKQCNKQHDSDTAVSLKQETQQQDQLCQVVDLISEDIKKQLRADVMFQQSIEKFTTTYNKLSTKSTNSHLITAFHKFGWCFGGSVTRKNYGVLRRGRRIPIQAKSAGKRKSIHRGKAAAAPGRASAAVTKNQKETEKDDRYFIPVQLKKTTQSKDLTL